MKKYDLIVVGGGFAGVASALSAAREGAKVLIVEKGNCFGGAAVNALVNPFMKNETVINGQGFPLSRGLFKTICDKLNERKAMRYTLFLEEELKRILNDMILEANIDVLFHSYIFNVKKSLEHIQSISVATISGVVELQADYFIDATGDAQVAFLAGCPTVLGRKSDNLCQPMTLCFRVGNIDVEKFMASREKFSLAYKKAFANGEFINPREDVLVFKNPTPNVLHFNTTRVVKLDPTSVTDVTKAEIIARKQVYEIYDFLKLHADGLENSFLMMTANQIGVRESRMIVGDYVLTENDCKDCVKFEDAIVACNYDIDIHNPEGTGTSHYFFPDGEFYTIPYRCLIPKNADNMLVAGRCISSDHGAQASYRIMPTVCCLGEAAGTAIGVAVKHKCAVRDINVKEVQKSLISNSAFIGIEIE